MVWHSRARGAEAVYEVDGVALRVEAVHERVLLLDAQPVPSDVRHDNLSSIGKTESEELDEHVQSDQRRANSWRAVCPPRLHCLSRTQLDKLASILRSKAGRVRR